MAEEAVVRKILREMRRAGAFVEKIHGGPYQPRIVDLFACYKGRFIGIEVKVPGKLPTPRQAYTLRKIVEAGGYGIAVTNWEQVQLVLREIDGEDRRRTANQGIT